MNAFATCGSFYELGGTLYREEFWLVNDRLGTPRMIVDKSGSLASVRRHDYLPFGEELFAGTGGRSATQGYSGDSTRQKFTGYENDPETGLNFAQARYQSSSQGRFTSVDPLMASASVVDPQSLNRYTYVNNNPVNFTDPTGMMLSDIGVYQTDNQAEANLLERKMIEDFRQAIRLPDPPSHSGGGEHHGGPETTSEGERNHADSDGPGEHSDSGSASEEGVHDSQSGYSDSNSECSLQVRFDGNLSLGTPRFSDGPDHRRLGEYVGRLDEYTSYSFRFEVTGTVSSGRIGHVGTKGVPGGGEWAIGQDKFPHTFRNGVAGRGNDTMSDDSPRYLRGKYQTVSIRGRHFSWSDGPGFLSRPDAVLTSGHFQSRFSVYASRNGVAMCRVDFGISGTFANGSWHAHMVP